MDRKKWIGGVGLFLYVWLMTGFATGTLTLLGPARWVTAALRGSSWSAHEGHAMKLVILVFVAGSFLLARLLTGVTQRTQVRPLRYGIPAVTTLAAGLALLGWSNPAVYAKVAGTVGDGEVKVGRGVEFSFGPYPDRARLEALKKEGYAGVVSLQHPAVVPFEPPRIEAERQATKELGIEFVHAPMLPWLSSNEESLKTVENLARTGRGRYYVHCGLGRDRTNIVKNLLQKMGASVDAAAANASARTFADRLEEKGAAMERGRFQLLEKDVWLIPHPNRDELYANMLGGQVAHVLLLQDPTDDGSGLPVDGLKQALKEHGVPMTVRTLRSTSRAVLADELADARRLPRPLVVVAPFTPPHPRGRLAAAVAEEWTTTLRGENTP